uniref:DUF834 domain-containing protein n=1 Tax=Oryza glumipatula TaxID=40148 RepID=A0A0D9ZDA1_9ORYZ
MAAGTTGMAGGAVLAGEDKGGATRRQMRRRGHAARDGGRGQHRRSWGRRLSSAEGGGAVEVCDDGDRGPRGLRQASRADATLPLDWADDAAAVGGDEYGPSGGEAGNDLTASGRRGGDHDKLGAGPCSARSVVAPSGKIIS